LADEGRRYFWAPDLKSEDAKAMMSVGVAGFDLEDLATKALGLAELARLLMGDCRREQRRDAPARPVGGGLTLFARRPSLLTVHWRSIDAIMPISRPSSID
jgi:hypothetical protein